MVFVDLGGLAGFRVFVDFGAFVDLGILDSVF
jgi:hypothetical protein